jgi:NAD(P)-dependent dehydrogenase (short-subunit alcohol dehydrogenase family)
VGVLDGKVAVITGAGRGIGRAEALLLASEGASVVVNDVGAATSGEGSDQRPAQDVVDEITTAGGTATANYDDITSWKGGENLVNQAIETYGGLDILVNNAGLYASLEMRPFDQIPLDEWRQVMDVNVASMFLTCRAAVPAMRERGGGRIVNISSGTPFRGVPFLLHYVTSKGAIVAFTRALAKELGKDNVLVNCVAPGFTMSAGVEAHPEVVEKLRDVSVAARTLQRDQVPEDVVGAVVYFCGPGSDFVTGQTIVIDGGQTFH